MFARSKYCPAKGSIFRQEVVVPGWKDLKDFELLFINGLGSFRKGHDYWPGKFHLVWYPDHTGLVLDKYDRITFSVSGIQHAIKDLKIKDLNCLRCKLWKRYI